MKELEKQNEQTKSISSIDEILKTVKQKEISYASQLWIPSLKKSVRFKELNTSQQKRLAKSIIDSPVYNTEFIFTFYDILKENCIEDIDISNLTVIDKLVIALGLRITCVGEMIDIDVTPNPDDEPIPVTIDLRDIYNIVKESVVNIDDDVVDSKIYKVTLGVPTLETEFLLETEMRSNVEKVEITTDKELRETIGTAFIGEIVKYIKGVSIKTDDGIREIIWSDFNFNDRITIIERFGTRLLKKILKYINTVKEETEKVELINFTYNDKKYDRRLAIDGSFFIVS